MAKPHVLMVTPYLPFPPNSGGRNRTFSLLRHLSKRYRFTLVCFGRPEEQAFDLSPLEALCDVIVVDRAPSPSTLQAAWLSVTSLRPITLRLYHTPAMERTLRQVLHEREIDLIHVESFYMMPNLPAALEMPVLLSEPAIEYVAWGRHARVAKPWYTRPGIALEGLKMRLWEPRSWSEATVVGVMSDVDAAEIGRVTPGVKMVSAPNGVDVDYFQPDDSVRRDTRTAVYLGDYKYFPNTDAMIYFTHEILPRVRQQRPDFQLTILGKEPPPALLDLDQNPGVPVTVTGFVDDTRPYLQSSAVFICPLRSGSGTRFKLLEALACGCPVVSTTIGAEGLDAVDGEHMLLRDTPQGFADAIVELLNHPERGAELARQGREWAIARHSWFHSAALLREAYDLLIGHEDPTLKVTQRQVADLRERQAADGAAPASPEG